MRLNAPQHKPYLTRTIGFGYRFDALNVHEEPNELNKAVATLFNAGGAFGVLRTLQLHLPLFRIIVSFFFISNITGLRSLKLIKSPPAERRMNTVHRQQCARSARDFSTKGR